jgi:hypothetical protein
MRAQLGEIYDDFPATSRVCNWEKPTTIFRTLRPYIHPAVGTPPMSNQGFKTFAGKEQAGGLEVCKIVAPLRWVAS